ncbi:MAG: cyclic nucleotide-binding domain-containing protein [Armatimonadota bacterium]|nr:cyclic nucleotide-binding domain-containing protein [Armatimonadota bacterium]
MPLFRSGSAKVQLLRSVPLFAGLSQRQLQQVAALAEELDVPEGHRLAAGETGHELFIIVDGEATVQTADRRTTRLGPGEFFGEMSLIDGGPRSATVVAKTPMKLLVVGHREFWALLNQAPQLTAKVMRALSERLRQAERAHTA